MPTLDLIRKVNTAAGLLTAAILLSACGGGDDGTEGTPATAATSERDATAQSASEADEPAPSAGVYYVDSRAGNDTYSGTAATAGADGVGPWRSLAKLASVSFAPGDVIRLVCGSSWRETLTLKSSGVAGSPISIVAYPAGCTDLPTIDGSVQISPSGWSLYKGNIYKAALSAAPLLLTSPTGTLTVAHHPNRGFDSAQPTSLYLRAAANSDNVVIGGHSASTYITTGADLVLPPGASLTAGTTVRIRPNAWTLDETTIASVAGSRITLAQPTSYPITKGWGYFLFGQLWMLDSPGEWFWDSAAKTVYASMPDGAKPSDVVRAAVLPTGVDLNKQQYVSLENIRIAMTGTGISMRNSVGISVRGVQIDDTADVAIDGYYGNGNLIKASTIRRSGGTAISVGVSQSTQIIDNTIVDAGVTMSGDAMVSLPRGTLGAVIGGLGAVITGNSITNAGYNGISAWNQTTISGNYVYGACSVLDDCGGIYTGGTDEKFSTITGNIVQHTRGNVEGNPSSPAVTQSQGIYLDNHASEVTVTGNTVVDADNGIQLHNATNNVVQGNKLYGNRQSQLLMNANDNSVRATGDVFGNTIIDNQIVATTSAARGLFLLTTIQDTTQFGQFDRNIYLDRIYARMSSETTPSSRIDYTFPTWRSAKLDDGTPRLLDVNGKATSLMQYAPALVTGANIVPNGNLTSTAPMWRGTWGAATRQACGTSYCANFKAGSSDGILSTPNFSVVKGQWYRVTVDVLAGVDGQQINMLVRRGGGGSNDYKPLSTTYFTASAARTWKRFTFTLQATATVNAGDPVTKDLGARLDIEHVKPGQVITVTNAEIVPITSVDDATKTALLLNTGASPKQVACPDASTAPALCSLYVRLSDSTPIVWPYSLPPRSSEIIYTLDPALIDSDADGIADSQDRCPGSPAGSAVNAAGCGL